MVPNCLVPGPKVIQGGKNIELVSETMIKEMVGILLVGLHIKIMLVICHL